MPTPARSRERRMSDTVIAARRGPVRLGALRGAAVESVGTSLPPRSVHSSAIAAVLGVSDGWIESRTGVRERRVAAPGDRLEELAADAGRDALERAGVTADSLDLVL